MCPQVVDIRQHAHIIRWKPFKNTDYLKGVGWPLNALAVAIRGAVKVMTLYRNRIKKQNKNIYLQH